MTEYRAWLGELNGTSQEANRVLLAGNSVTVLYVVGSGRSGSTMLDIMLGNCSDVESVGELVNVMHSGWIDGQPTRSPYCACGRLVTDCPFWNSVKREWTELVGKNINEYRRLQYFFERFRRLPRLLQEQKRSSAQFRSYAEFTATLFKAIHTASGKSVVVDSSKSPIRAFALSLIPEIDLRLVHLVRDERGVAASQSKTFKKDQEAGLSRDIKGRSIWESAAIWTVSNLLSELTRKRLHPDKSLLVRYENFVTNPENELLRIRRIIQDGSSHTTEVTPLEKDWDVGHNVGGNRLRMAGRVKLRSNAGNWKEGLSAREKQTSWLLTGWLMRRYGYEK